MMAFPKATTPVSRQTLRVPGRKKRETDSKGERLFFSPVERIIARNTAQLFSNSRPSASLRQLHRKLWNEDL